MTGRVHRGRVRAGLCQCAGPALLATLVLIAPAAAEQDEPRIRFDFDKATAARNPIGNGWSAGIEVEFTATNEHNFDLENPDEEDFRGGRAQIALSAAWEPDPRWRFFGEMKAKRDIVDRSPRDNDRSLRVELDEAYATWRVPGDWLTATIGRRSVTDEREWLIDETLDGIQLVGRWPGFAVEAAAMREQVVARELGEPPAQNKPDLFYLRAYVPVGEVSQVDAYALFERGRGRNRGDDFNFYGVSSAGELADDLEYWLEVAMVTGAENGRDVRGYGADLGATYTLKQVPMRPYVMAGVAFGTGDDGQGTDTAFRQTDLQGNSAKYGGVEGIKYYGELVDPELSNLVVTTLGAGFRPLPRTSIDLVWHRYWQRKKTDFLRDSSLDEDPTGLSRDIGDEIDVVIGVRDIPNIDLELIGGVFFPGTAYDNDDDTALFLEATLTLRF